MVTAGPDSGAVTAKPPPGVAALDSPEPASSLDSASWTVMRPETAGALCEVTREPPAMMGVLVCRDSAVSAVFSGCAARLMLKSRSAWAWAWAPVGVAARGRPSAPASARASADRRIPDWCISTPSIEKIVAPMGGLSIQKTDEAPKWIHPWRK
ncbi:hypothetical protein D3C71_1639660 [compost metagenome]